MKQLLLHPLSASTMPVTFPTPPVAGARFQLWMDNNQLAVSDADEEPRDATPVADLFLPSSTNGPLCHVVTRHPNLRVDGFAPLPLATLSPGSLVYLGEASWFVTARWQAAPGPAPPELAERKCPVCGGELKLAPVLQCICGRYVHLEKPDAPAGADVLNCALAGPCGLCNRPPSLEPLLTPEPPDKLLDVTSAE